MTFLRFCRVSYVFSSSGVTVTFRSL